LRFFNYFILSAVFWHFSIYSVNFTLFTCPKTGTHLLKPILAELTGKSPLRVQEYRDNLDCAWILGERGGSFLHLHVPYSQEVERFLRKKHCTAFFVKRDPRDRIVSLLNHYKRFGFLDPIVEKIPTDDERLLYMIRKKLKSETLQYMGWLHSSSCCTLDFAKLMGAHGGAATDADALGEMRKIAKTLELEVSDDYLEEVYRKHFGQDVCFFRGKVGSWRDYFTEQHKRVVKKEIGELLIQLGYEKNYNW